MNKMLPIRHGGDILAVARSLGCSPAELDDMSSNLAPFGPAPGVREALLARLDEIAYLPESGSESLRDCLAARYNRGREEILAGNGTTEFIFALFGSADRIIFPARNFICGMSQTKDRF